MSGINSKENNYVKFYLDSSIYNRVEMKVEPIGWDDADLELSRSKEHGIFNQISGSLEFYDYYKDVIENTFQALGNNGSLYLIKEELLDNGTDVVWTEIYRGRADWESKEINNNILKINFNSNELEEVFEAHESDDFSIETTKSIDDVDIGEFEKFKTDIEGRELFSAGKSILLKRESLNIRDVSTYGEQLRGLFFKSEIVSYGHPRFSSVDLSYYNRFPEPIAPELESYGIDASHMFFTDVTAIENNLDINVRIREEFRAIYSGGYTFDVVHRVRLVKLKRTWSGTLDRNYYNIVNTWELIDPIVMTEGQWHSYEINFEEDINLAFDEGLAIWHQFFHYIDGNYGSALGTVYASAQGNAIIDAIKQDINVVVKTYHEPSIDLDVTFVHDVFSRLANVITGKKNLVYSKYFGRTELGYETDGEAGLVGLISGYWVRAFNPLSERYKSPVFSWKKLLESCNSVFNIGIGTEVVNGLKRFRIEEVEYFYQSKVVIDLGRVTDVKRKYDKLLYFSGLEIGYNKGGDYENAYGLDEPNILSRFVTPDRKSTNKYRKVSDIRADETGLELTRRKPEIDFPDEDTSADEHNWLLDLKRGFNGKFQQRNWDDRLAEIPTGINAPTNFKSFFFTPLRMLLRHGWILRSGLETYLSRKIKWISSTANSKLSMQYIGEPEALQEDLPDGLLVNKLERSKFLPEEITFNKTNSRALIEQIYGKTRIFYKGSWENIPNYYFKFRWINENDEEEAGYLMNFKPSDLAEFKMQKFNNKKIQ